MPGKGHGLCRRLGGQKGYGVKEESVKVLKILWAFSKKGISFTLVQAKVLSNRHVSTWGGSYIKHVYSMGGGSGRIQGHEAKGKLVFVRDLSFVLWEIQTIKCLLRKEVQGQNC